MAKLRHVSQRKKKTLTFVKRIVQIHYYNYIAHSLTFVTHIMLRLIGFISKRAFAVSVVATVVSAVVLWCALALAERHGRTAAMLCIAPFWVAYAYVIHYARQLDACERRRQSHGKPR